MRDAINNDERIRLVAAVQAGMPWEQARSILLGVDPVALDKNWRDTVFRLAGYVEEASEPVEPLVEAHKAKPKKKG